MGVKLSGPKELGNALKEALELVRGPVVIEVPMPTLPAPFQVKLGKEPSASRYQ
jgi:hypothetical protein